jgi:hypothetical protein
VPVTPVAFHVAEPDRQLVLPRLDFLQADDVRPVAFNPFLHLCLPGANSVHVPRGDLHAPSMVLHAMRRGLPLAVPSNGTK